MALTNGKIYIFTINKKEETCTTMIYGLSWIKYQLASQ